MNKCFLTLIATVSLSTAAAAQEPSDWWQNLREHKSEPPGLLWRKSDPPVIAEGTPPSGRVDLKGGSFAAGIGYVWGHGTLNYGARNYKVTLSGLSAVNVGAATISATGEVYHLTQLQDFAGSYDAVSAGATIGAGGSMAYLKNEHGVVIRLHSSTTGLQFNLDVSGVKIELQSK
jgi:hypothetical protein